LPLKNPRKNLVGNQKNLRLKCDKVIQNIIILATKRGKRNCLKGFQILEFGVQMKRFCSSRLTHRQTWRIVLEASSGVPGLTGGCRRAATATAKLVCQESEKISN